LTVRSNGVTDRAYRTEQDYTRHLSGYANSLEAIDRFVTKG
jgi:hypothetical protein